jgi:uncharacterized protein YdiU (UPF0061 family)
MKDHQLSNDEKKCSIDVLQPWFEQWYKRRQQQNETWTDVKLVMKYHNPYIIPRNYQVEKALNSAKEKDLKSFNDLLKALSHPFEYNEQQKKYTRPPNPLEEIRETYCGT